MMDAAEKYWTFVELNSAGQRRIKTLSVVQVFVQQQFAGLTDATEMTHSQIQRQLVALMRSLPDAAQRQMASCSLRCFISNEIDRVCGELAMRFGQTGGFSKTELLVRVLDDVDIFEPLHLADSATGESSLKYQPLAARILQTFDPDQSQLSTWTKRLVTSHAELNRFLQKECGVYLASDWSILNGMTSERLRRLLRGQYLLTPEEVEPWCHLLEGYHAVYRSDRLLHRRSSRAKCVPPTSEQVIRIVNYLAQVGLPGYAPQRVMWELQTLADKIRRCRTPKLETLDTPNQFSAEQLLPKQEEDTTHQEFLTRYRHEFQACLEQAICQVVSDRLTYHHQRRPPTDQPFLTALHLFHCQDRSMTEIAKEIGLQKQYQVSRLLGLKELRADIRQTVLLYLLNRVQALAADYVEGDRLKDLEQEIEAALRVLLDQIFEDARAAASTPQRAQPDLFTHCLCRYLDTRRCSS